MRFLSRERRIAVLATAVSLLWLPSTSWAQNTPPSPRQSSSLTLPQALQKAEAANPVLLAKLAQMEAADGVQLDANALLASNPQLSVDLARRSVSPSGLPVQRNGEWGAGVSQAFETGGQRSYRRDAASASLSALRAEIEDTRRILRTEVATRFYRVLALQQRIALEAQSVRLFDDTAAAVQKRRVAGEDTKLDANITVVEAERARNQLAVIEEQLNDARSELAAQLQLPPQTMPVAEGTLELLKPRYTLAQLLEQVAQQPRLSALEARENSALAKLKLEQASTAPDVTVGLSVGRQGPSDSREITTMLSVSVPLPLFKRNATGIGQARTELSQVQIDRHAAIRDAHAQVQSLWARLASLESRVRRLQDTVLPTLADNQQLSVKSQRAGQIGLLELIVVSRQSLDARRDLNEALSDYHATRLTLERAAGWTQE
jgi:outer membrane protein, heavy metal efflux system